MFGIGLPEMVIIAIVALIFIGPDKLPSVLRSVGKGLVELKRATSQVRSTVQEEMYKIEEEIELDEVRKSAQDLTSEIGSVASEIDSLSISKLSSESNVDKKKEPIESTEKNNQLNALEDKEGVSSKNS